MIEKEKELGSRAITISEIVLTLFPILVIFLLSLYKNNPRDSVFSSDWSYITIILFGQSMLRFIGGIAKNENRKRWQITTLVASLLIVIGFIPSVVVLVLIETSVTERLWLFVVQWIYAALSIICYYVIGAVGSIMLESKKI